MLYELRIYHTMPGRLPDLNKRFETRTLKIWERLGFRPVGFWTVMIGESNADLYYMLAWENLAEREQKFATFQVDPEWLQVRAETESNGPLISSFTNTILSPTGFSAMK